MPVVDAPDSDRALIDGAQKPNREGGGISVPQPKSRETRNIAMLIFKITARFGNKVPGRITQSSVLPDYTAFRRALNTPKDLTMR